MTSDDDIEVSLPLEGAPEGNAEKLHTDYDRPSYAGLPDLAAGPRDPAPPVRDGGHGARGLGARDQIGELANEALAQEGDLALVHRAIRMAAERAKVVGQVQLNDVGVGIRVTSRDVRMLIQPPTLMMLGAEDLPADVREFVGAVSDALGYEVLPEPVPSPSAPRLRIMAVQKAMIAEFMAVVGAHREAVAEMARGPEDQGWGDPSS